jgi:cell division protein FtsX
MPDVVVVTLPEAQDVDAFIQRVRSLPGVRYAEPDAMRFTS